MTVRPSPLRLSRHAVLLLASGMVMAVGSIATHTAGAAEGAGEAAEHADHLAIPTIVGPLGALLLLSVIWLLRGRVLRPAWFFILPPAAFAIQELAERLTQASAPEPSQLVTVLMQAVFALLAFLLARAALGAVRRVVRFLAGSRHPTLGAPAFAWLVAFVSMARLRARAGAHLGRAPPAVA